MSVRQNPKMMSVEINQLIELIYFITKKFKILRFGMVLDSNSTIYGLGCSGVRKDPGHVNQPTAKELRSMTGELYFFKHSRYWSGIPKI